MALTLPTVEQVRAICPAPNLTDAQVQSFIDDAALMAEDCVSAQSAARQVGVIKWLAAHLISTAGVATGAASGVIQSQSLGDASESYAVAATADMLKGTAFGQQAMLMDPTGCLANLGKRKSTFQIIGQNRSREYYDPTESSNS
jgi:hypothetical protein